MIQLKLADGRDMTEIRLMHDIAQRTIAVAQQRRDQAALGRALAYHGFGDTLNQRVRVRSLCAHH